MDRALEQYCHERFGAKQSTLIDRTWHIGFCKNIVESHAFVVEDDSELGGLQEVDDACSSNCRASGQTAPGLVRLGRMYNLK